jgi:hypothetical protein
VALHQRHSRQIKVDAALVVKEEGKQKKERKVKGDVDFVEHQTRKCATK